ncbi:MAG: Sjogren's syndrome/scleroderma autoantigen 1 family protein [Candidatus Thorarchaeota archaeon]
MTKQNDASIKKMAELLRQGATMLAQGCPQCGSPLMKMGDDVYCTTCDRRIVVVDSQEQAASQTVKALIPELHEILTKKLKTLSDVIEAESDTEELTKLANLMVLLLQSLERLESMAN